MGKIRLSLQGDPLPYWLYHLQWNDIILKHAQIQLHLTVSGKLHMPHSPKCLQAQ